MNVVDLWFNACTVMRIRNFSDPGRIGLFFGLNQRDNSVIDYLEVGDEPPS